MKRSRHRDRIERDRGPLADVLRALAAEGISQREAGARLGVSGSAVSNWLHRLGIEWPPAMSRGTRRRWMRDATRRVRLDGEILPIAEAARRKGLPVGTVHERWHQGDRTAARLLRPIYGHGRQLAVYELGLSAKEWEWIVDYARERGADAAAQKFGAPLAAIKAGMRGEWERCA